MNSYKNELGASMLEYSILAALVSVCATVAIVFCGQVISTKFVATANMLNAQNNSPGTAPANSSLFYGGTYNVPVDIQNYNPQIGDIQE
jgi:Flp pilus assembly pilin Flp